MDENDAEYFAMLTEMQTGAAALGDREDRERRSRDDHRSKSTTAEIVFVIGNSVLHDLLGEAKVRKLARDDDTERKVNIEWSRPGKKKKDPVVLHNRWVFPSSLTKIVSSTYDAAAGARNDSPQGLVGQMPNLAAIERER